ncbi:MAG: hypothetical protein AB7J40_03990 [Candidatus Altimarinota bacterium]
MHFPHWISSLFVILLALPIGGLTGYLDALVYYDEYHSHHQELIQNELFSLDNQIAHHKYQIELKSSSKQNVLVPDHQFVFCNAEITPPEKSIVELEQALNQLEEKEKRIWEYTKIHEQLPVHSELKAVKNPVKWASKIIHKGADMHRKYQDEQKLIEFWSSRSGTIPEFVTVYATSLTDEAPELNPLHVNQISAAIALMPKGFEERLKAIYMIHGEEKIRRGSAGLGVVFIDAEKLNIFPILIHEFGHLYDFHVESEEGDPSPFHNGIAQLSSEDPSVKYYQISWQDNQHHRGNTEDFCSCYGSENPQEDFAEAFSFYVLQGSTFEKWSKKNPILKQKYDFIKEVFNGRIFSSPHQIHQHPFSVVDLPIDYPSLL